MTFLMSDIAGSTRPYQQAAGAYLMAREQHNALLRAAFARHGGHEIKETGDGFVAAFPTAGSALSCAVSAQKALAAEAWPAPLEPLSVRMAIHTGDVQQDEAGEYQGILLHHTSRMSRPRNP